MTTILFAAAMSRCKLNGTMKPHTVFYALALFAGFSFFARADVLPDPEIAVDLGSLSSKFAPNAPCLPVVPGTNTPAANGGGVCDFYNASNSDITLLALQATVNRTLTPNSGFSSLEGFNCNPDGVFTTCLITIPNLAPAMNDVVIFQFFGTDGTHPGIDPLPAGCLSHPDAVGCTTSGHFAFNLNNGNVLTGDVGGWTGNDAGTFKALSAQFATPEPSLTWLLGAGSVLIFGFARRRKQGRS